MSPFLRTVLTRLAAAFILAGFIWFSAWVPAGPASSAAGKPGAGISSTSAPGTGLAILPEPAATPDSPVLFPSPPVLSLPAVQWVEKPSPSPGWIWNPPGEATVPILLYHHVADVDPPSRYFVPVDQFEAQVRSLYERGYTPISIDLLVRAVETGADLPPRPVILTFDDGYADIYENAFPILQQYGFTGIVYMISSTLDSPGYLSIPQSLDLVAAGWKIGSHTMTHSDLREYGLDLKEEIESSRLALEEAFGVAIDTFSFPYGLTNSSATEWVKHSYQNAVGLGGLSRHVPSTRYYLSRIEVEGNLDLDGFAGLLPGSGLP